MKNIIIFFVIIFSVVVSTTGQNIIKKEISGKMQINPLDTVYFDLSQAVISGGYVSVPVYILAYDTIHSLDFSLKYNHNKVVYNTIQDLTTYMQGVVYSYNTNDSLIMFTSYSPQVYENFVPLVYIKFFLISSQLLNSDIYSIHAYLNGEEVGTRVIGNAVMDLNFDVTFTSCIGTNNGSIDLAVIGGTPPYTYLWSNSDTTQNIQNLSTGYYSVTVTDNAGYIKVDSAFVSEPFLSFWATNPSCTNYGDGNIILSISGGTSPFFYLWSNSDTTKDLQYLAAGIYSVTVTDSTGCVLTGSQELSDSAGMHVTYNVISPSCPNYQDGSIEVFVTGGQPNYIYHWSTSSTSSFIDSLASGIYNLTLTDQQGCILHKTINVIEPPGMMLLFMPEDLSCSNVNDGKIELFISGGYPPFVYQWSNFETTKDIENLMAGNYSVTVTDMHGCIVNDTISVGITTEISLHFNKFDISCYGENNGLIELNVEGGVPPFDVNWSNGDSLLTISNLSAGSYIVTVTQSSFCYAIDSVKINNAPSVNIIESITNPTCSSNNNGSINVLVHGGISPYTYAWSNSETEETISDLNTGIYTVTVTDANNCIAIDSFILNSDGNHCLEIFSAFSPNGDGVNDTWEITNIEQYPECTVDIYNQWGIEIFRSTGYDVPWDGRRKGNKLPSAAYYYVIDLGNGDKYSGSVTILK